VTASRDVEKTAKVLGILARQYRRLPSLKEVGLLDRLVLLLLAKDAPPARALAALERLRGDFVDWNEVRVSSPLEIQRSLEDLDEDTLVEKAQKVRGLLGRIFEKHHSLKLERLLEEDRPARERFLESLEVLEPWAAHVFLASLDPEGDYLFHPNAARVLQRVGVLARTASPTKALEGIRGLVRDDDPLTVQALLVRHGDEICGPRVFLCERCRVLPLCKFGRARKR
jgi:endonuclease III